MTTKHLIYQFKTAIRDALASKKDVRAVMRACSGKQRFPVSRWVRDLEALQTTAIEKHKKYARRGSPQSLMSTTGSAGPPEAGIPNSRPGSNGSQTAGNDEKLPEILRSFGGRECTRHTRNFLHESQNPQNNGFPSGVEEGFSDEQVDVAFYGDAPVASAQSHGLSRSCHCYWEPQVGAGPGGEIDDQDPSFHALAEGLAESQLGTPPLVTSGMNSPTRLGIRDVALSAQNVDSSHLSLLSVQGVIKEKQDYNLQKVDPFFTDSTREYAKVFKKKLENLSAKNSERQLCIEEYLSKSEKDWFNRYRAAKLGRSSLGAAPASSAFRLKINSKPPTLRSSQTREEDQFPLWKGYVPPSGLRRIFLARIGDWPLYSILLGLVCLIRCTYSALFKISNWSAQGQIIAANSYQVTLLTGEVGQRPEKLYVVTTIYLISSIIWWTLFRTLKPIFVLSIPFLVRFSVPAYECSEAKRISKSYGLAFFFVGLSPFARPGVSQAWMQNIATGLYAFASSSGSVFFGLNFGDEGNASPLHHLSNGIALTVWHTGNAPVTSWVYRACVIQGTQQIYVTALWYWGASLATHSPSESPGTSLNSKPHLVSGIGIGIAVLMWIVGIAIFRGLPDYYRQAPGKVPSFYRTLFHRKIVLVCKLVSKGSPTKMLD
jgi:alpha-1,3-glucan synthase